MLRKTNITVVAIAVTLFIIMISGCWERVDTEASRLTSPDNKVDAVYIQSSAGAMTSVHHTVYIVPKGQQITKRDKAVFSGNRVWDVKLSWTSNNELCVQHGEGKIYHFQNYCYPFPKDRKYEVRISEEQVGEQ
jgi:hypothetical protein